MAYLTEALERKQNELEHLIKKVENNLLSSTKGNIKVITEKSGKLRYQVRFSKDDKYTYVSCKEGQLIRRMIQRDYDLKLLKSAKEELHDLVRFKDKYDDKKLSDLYKNLNPARKLHLKEAVLTDEEYGKKWEQEKYIRNPEQLPGLYFTKRGEEVRSKIEARIADKLIDAHCFYRLEPKVKLAPGITYYPDFMILNARTKEVYLLEHFGKMSDPNYIARTMKKIVNYEKYATKYKNHLIMTFEDKMHPYDGSDIPMLAEKYFL